MALNAIGVIIATTLLLLTAHTSATARLSQPEDFQDLFKNFYTQDPDTTLSFEGMCKHHNYPVQTHKVTTDDGYILTMFRIPGSPKSPTTTTPHKKSVVFMQHGILDSADTFINNGPGLAPAFVLADTGYDVWLGNSRGSFYSRQHIILNPDKDSDYWQFSFEKMGQYDITAEVQYVLNYTGVKKVTYLGHSQGTTQMFYSLAQNISWWRSRISSFVALGPVCKVHNAQSTLLNTLAYSHSQYLLKLAGINQILPRNYLQNKIFSKACQYAPIICSTAMYFVSDSEFNTNNPQKMQVFMAHYPSGTSTMSLDHFAQLMVNDNFAKYDFGQQINIQVYGQKHPPTIDISNITNIPTALVIGNHDELATIQDSKWIIQNLGKDSLKKVDYIDGGHLTFILGKDSDYLKNVVDFIGETMKQSQDNNVEEQIIM